MHDTNLCVDTGPRYVGVGDFRYCAFSTPFARFEIQTLDLIGRTIEFLSRRFSRRFAALQEHFIVDRDCDVSPSR